jgi:hypothetical protein
MFNKLVTAIEPFAFTLVILVGANLAGWVQFSNHGTIGIVVVFLGSLLIVKHIWGHITEDKKVTKK